MQVVFCTSNKPGSLLIRAITWSRWSHVAIVLGDQVIEAVWPHVRVRPLADLLKDHPVHVVVDLPCRSETAARDALHSQIGKPYDLSGMFGLALHRDWQEDDRWWCSELVAWAFDQGGSPLFRPEAMHRVTPEHLWMIAPDRQRADLVFFPTLGDAG